MSVDKHARLPGRDWWPEEAVAGADVNRLQAAAGPAGVDVLFTHDTVTGAPLPTAGPRLPDLIQLECDMNRRHVADAVTAVRPGLLVHGHYHELLDYHMGQTRVLSLGMELDEGSLALLTL